MKISVDGEAFAAFDPCRDMNVVDIIHELRGIMELPHFVLLSDPEPRTSKCIALSRALANELGQTYRDLEILRRREAARDEAAALVQEQRKKLIVSESNVRALLSLFYQSA